MRGANEDTATKDIVFNYNLIGDNSTVVKIFLKSGITRYGIILGDVYEKSNGCWQFVSYNNVETFYETLQSKYIELIDENSVLAIDPYLK